MQNNPNDLPGNNGDGGIGTPGAHPPRHKSSASKWLLVPAAVVVIALLMKACGG